MRLHHAVPGIKVQCGSRVHRAGGCRSFDVKTQRRTLTGQQLIVWRLPKFRQKSLYYELQLVWIGNETPPSVAPGPSSGNCSAPIFC